MKTMSRMVALPQFFSSNHFHSLEPFFIEEILNLITDQAKIYGKGKKQSSSLRKTSKWKDLSKEIGSFLRLVLLVGTNHSTNRKLYSSNNMLFHPTFISSMMSRARFLEIVYNLHLANNSLKPKQESKDYSKILLKFCEGIFKKEYITLAVMVQFMKV